MGIGSNRQVPLIVAGAFLTTMAFAAPSAQSIDYNSGIWRVLRAGHFSGPMRRNARGYAHVLPIKGEIVANGLHYRFWEYGYDSKYSGQSAGALLVFEEGAHGLSYLGCYRMEPLEDFKGPVHPVIRGKSVFFPFHTYEILGDKHSFAVSFEDGPPAKIATSEFQQ
jgi:hypothetical protein